MGPISTKVSRRALLPFESRIHYFTEHGVPRDFAGVLQFRGCMLNANLPKEVLVVISSFVHDLSCLGTLSQVCQLWYFVVAENDSFWANVLDHPKLHGGNYSAKSCAFDYLYRYKQPWVADIYRPKINEGYSRAVDSLTITVEGLSRAGKSALVHRFAYHTFDEITDPTVDDWCQRTRNINGKSLEYNLLDTASADFELKDDLYKRFAKFPPVRIIVYDSTSLDSFKHAVELLELYCCVNRFNESKHGRVHDHRVNRSVFLVGTKCDVKVGRVIQWNNAMALAYQYTVGFLETSAKTGENVEKLFRFVGEFSLLQRSNPLKAELVNIHVRD